MPDLILGKQLEPELAPSAIAQQRLISQRIGTEKGIDPAAVVRWMGAMQAQDYGQVMWAVGLRTQSSSVLEVEQAIAHRSIVITWLMRGTIHLVFAEDAQWMSQLFGPRLLAAAGTRRQQLEIDQALIDRTKTLFCRALRDGQQLTRAAFMQLLEQAGISPKGQRGYHLLWSLALEGLICFGPRRHHEQTFVLLEEWVPNPRSLSKEEAVAELATRYFTSHGPASLHDFAGWTGLPMAEARRGHEAIKAGLLTEKVAGSTQWLSALTSVVAPSGLPRVCLLPGFDEYFLGYKDRSAVLATEHANHICPGGNGIFKPMLVVDGQIVGTWKPKISEGKVAVAAQLFLPAQVPQAAIEAAAVQYCHFLGLPPGTVTLSEDATD
ncbi:winged helix DNA-binding domain-containing protein [uncultured Hymenobacter sp.]|uniref:winged helix DNA-binding domain-containing protein n=1 Tax=uncultured Hymenobacter sp. TaxID=170016 RepID=UPI0035CA211B